MSRFPLITVEKYMGPFPLPAGEGEEDNVAAVAHAVKSLNPESKVLMYVNSQFAYPFYRLFEVADRGQYWVVNEETGKPFTHEVIDLNCSNPGRCPGKTVGYWDFQHEELQAAWVAACSNPKIDGCFVDGATSDPPFPPSQNATGYEHARAATLASIAAKSLVVINDKKYYDPAPPYPTAQGEFIETFSGSSVKWMQILNRTRHSMRQPRMILAHTGSRNDGLCHDGGDPSEGSRDLAAFLMVAEEHTYFGCSNWEDVPTWPQEYDKPLGQPLGPALQEPDGTWRRRFAHGTNCSINFETGKFSIDWAQA